MSQRLLVTLLVVQSAILLLLVAERFVPVAHAQEGMACTITNWPDALTGKGFDAVRVKVEEVRTPVPIAVKDWDTSDRVHVQVDDWNTSDRVEVRMNN
ncbi:MAG: hypothetical protein H6733_05125 [Alphaproteobacteria bacterium]|nr:hypothetical protein [Alphaproteobacteria bacterium]